MNSGDLHRIGKHKLLIVVCHGFNSSSRNETLVAIVNGLNKNGFDTLTFNFSENLGGFDVEHQVNDIAAIVGQQETYKTIVLLAASFAALPAAIASKNIPHVHGLITLNGFFGRGALGEPYRKPYVKFRLAALLIPKYRRILHYFKRELRPAQIAVPVLVIHSKADIRVYLKQSQHFFDRLTTSKKFITLQSANHGIADPKDRATVVADIADWLHKTF